MKRSWPYEDPFISIENKLSIEAFVLFGPASIEWGEREREKCVLGRCVCVGVCVCVRERDSEREREVIGRLQVTITL